MWLKSFAWSEITLPLWPQFIGSWSVHKLIQPYAEKHHSRRVAPPSGMVGTLSSQKGVQAELTANQTITPFLKMFTARYTKRRQVIRFKCEMSCSAQPTIQSQLGLRVTSLRLTGQLNSKISFNKLIHTHQKSKTKNFPLYKFKKISYQGHSTHQLSKNTGKKWQ